MTRLADLKPCREGLDRARAAWHAAPYEDLAWLVGRAHSHGTLSRRRIVEVTLAAVALVEDQMSPASRECLVDLRRWAAGDDGVDLAGVWHSAWDAAAAGAARSVRAAYDAAYYAGAAARVAADATYAAAYDAATVVCAAVHAAHAARDADADDDAADAIRDAITVDEVCTALDLDTEEVIS